MAKDTANHGTHASGEIIYTFYLEQLVAFARLVAAKSTEEANARANASWTLMCKKMVSLEREACAKVCEQTDEDFEGPDQWDWHSKDYASAIRARGEA
jgi:hypothetical protein